MTAEQSTGAASRLAASAVGSAAVAESGAGAPILRTAGLTVRYLVASLIPSMREGAAPTRSARMLEEQQDTRI